MGRHYVPQSRFRYKKARKIKHFVAIGANLPGSRGTNAVEACSWALAALLEIPGLTLTTRSRWFSTAPVPPSAQPRFVNGVAALEGDADPDFLLRRLHAIEAEAGRIRTAPNAARPLDLDLLDSGGIIRPAPDPVLPHPRLQHRAFVLLPLRDVAPRWRHPVSGLPIGQLIAALEPQDIHPL